MGHKTTVPPVSTIFTENETGLDQGLSALPLASPLMMPEQSLKEGRLRVPRQSTSPRGIGMRRAYLLGLTYISTMVATWIMAAVFMRDGLNVLEGCVLALFVCLFAWITLSFASALAGFFCVICNAGRKLGIDPQAPLPSLHTRTALLMPTYHEEPRRLIAGLQAIYESVAETGSLEHFDFFVLSDSRRIDIAQAEEEEYLAICKRLNASHRIFYRRRRENIARKAGNIADWVRRFGGSYAQMIILDADSVMTGDTIVRLVAAMEQHPDVGLIQSLPEVVGGRSFFARMQQFSNHVYGPIVAYGVAWWHGAESNYWGHNAVIRTRAFADHAGLPTLKGLKPFGGHVLSHDFVEAALIRRGGWAVHMVPYLQGSYEEGPPTLTDLLIRDRRWCQGNLQHMKVVTAVGLHWVSRMHMLIGIGHYLTAPMWGLMMLMGVGIPLVDSNLNVKGALPPTFLHYLHQLHLRGDHGALWVFVVSMSFLLAPKGFGYFALLLDQQGRRECGGAIRVFFSILVETVFAALMAPVVMYIQSRGVSEVIAGKDSGWDAQRRDDDKISWRNLIRSYGEPTVFGLLIGALSYFVSPSLTAWMAPVIIGMVLSIPVVAFTSLRSTGDFLLRRKIFAIPEETATPSVLLRAIELREAAHDDALWAQVAYPKLSP